MDFRSGVWSKCTEIRLECICVIIHFSSFYRFSDNNIYFFFLQIGTNDCCAVLPCWFCRFLAGWSTQFIGNSSPRFPIFDLFLRRKRRLARCWKLVDFSLWTSCSLPLFCCLQLFLVVVTFVLVLILFKAILTCFVLPYSDTSQCMEANFTYRPIVNCLPAWFRFAQCLRRYRDSREAFPHLVNAGKYSTTFLVVIFATLRAYQASVVEYTSTFDNPYTIYWLLSSFLASTYAYIWDIKMDWGLFDNNAGENKFLREEVVYSSTVSIWFVIPCVFGPIYSNFLGLLLLCHHWGSVPAFHLGYWFRSNRIQNNLGRFANINHSATWGFPSVRVELLPFGERAPEQLR